MCQDLPVLRSSARALRFLALESGGASGLVGQGAVGPVLGLFSSPGAKSDRALLTHAAAAFVNLARHEASRAQIVGAGAVKQLVQLCGSSRDPAVLEYTALSLHLLAEQGAARGVVAAEGALGSLLQVCAVARELGDDKVLAMALNALASLARDEQTMAEMARADDRPEGGEGDEGGGAGGRGGGSRTRTILDETVVAAVDLVGRCSAERRSIGAPARRA